jgi:hypothetical protein
MAEPPEKPPAAKRMPMTEWLALMLTEIERKDTEASAAREERQRREQGETRGDDPAGSADVT